MFKIKNILHDEKGSIAPLTAVILILCIGLGAVNLAITMLYRDRTVVRDALDAACTSSLVAATEERWRALRYLEEPIIEVSSDYQVTFEYYPYEEMEKSYIYIDRVKAEQIAKEVFEENLRLSGVPYILKDFKVEITYEPHNDSREPVLKERYEVTTQPESWWITEQLYNPDEIAVRPDPWNVNIYRDLKQVKFPRWVKVQSIAKLDLKTPFAKMINSSETVEIVMKSDVVKELDVDTREEQETYSGY